MKNKLALFGAAAMLMASTSCVRIEDREAGIRTKYGKVTDVDVEKGLKWDTWWFGVDYIQVPLTLQKLTVKATEEEDVTIRTKEDARIYGSFEVHYEMNNKDKNFGNLYTELKADEIEDLEPFIQNYTVPAAIDIYKNVPTSELNANLTQVGENLSKRLQEIIDSKGYTYIRIKDVIPTGVGLSDQANKDLEKIVSEERKLDLLRIQGQVADKSLEITKKQTAVTIEALEQLKKAGVPEDQVIQAYYLQLMRDNDVIGKQFVPGPIPGTGVGAIAPK